MRDATERDVIEVTGTVLRENRGDLYDVEIDFAGSKRTVLAKRAGRLAQRFIRIIPGDVVTIELSPYDTSRGRIVFRGVRHPRSSE